MKTGMRIIAEMMAIAARTAPKAAGRDFVALKVVEGETLARLADAMVRYGQDTGKKNFDRDGENIRQSDALLLVGLEQSDPVGLNCGACGNERCADLERKTGSEFAGPLCAWRIVDLGIALGSAAKTASIFNADNRIMYRAGVVARQMGLMEGELVIGIPISATGKNIYFDR
ncbi:MAG: ferredoxin domain-containing protein [Bacillota bacterium]